MAEYFGPDLVLLEKLDAGAMAEVFRAKLVGTGGFEKIVAVKRILPHFAGRPEFRERFQMEMNLVAMLQHPNIVQVFKNGERNEFLFLVMEFVNGKNLSALMQRARDRKLSIPIEIACHIVSEVAKGLEYAHNYRDEMTAVPQHIIHRDINPHNIMVGYRGEIKLVDFGIAKAAGQVRMTRMGDLKGTVPYCSPEQVEGEDLDLRTDIFSLGVVFWELLSGQMLFDAESTFEIIKKVKDCVVPSLGDYRSDVPSELEIIVQKALNPKRAERYQTDQDFYREITIFRNKCYPKFIADDFAAFTSNLFQDEINRELRERRTDSQSTAFKGTSRSIPQRKLNRGVGTRFMRIARDTSVYLLRRDRVRFFFLVILGAVVSMAILLGPSMDWKGLRLLKLKAVPALNPAELPGIVGWYKADSLDQRDGEPVLVWFDSARGQSNATQSEPRYQPFVKTKAVNGLPAVVFDGGNSFLNVDAFATSFSKARAASFVYVVKPAVDHLGYLIAAHGQDHEFDLLRVGFSTAGRVRTKSEFETGVYHDSSTGEVKVGHWYVGTALFEIDHGQVYHNSRTVLYWPLKRSIDFSLMRKFVIGQEWDKEGPSDFFNGELAELIVFSRGLLEWERKRLEYYLAKKYGLLGQGNFSDPEPY